MPRTSTSPHAAADGAPGQGRAAPAGRAAATTKAPVKAAPAEPKPAGKARTAKSSDARPPAASPSERRDGKAAKLPAKAGRADAKAGRADGKVDKAAAVDKAATTAHKVTTAHKATTSAHKATTTAHKAAAGDTSATTTKVDKGPVRAEKATKAPAKAPAKATTTKAAPKAPAHRPASHAPAHRSSTSPAPAAPVAPPSPAPVTVGYAGDAAFLDQQRQALLDERATYTEQARALRAEAESLVQEMEPGDVQFDDESGEGGTTTVDRERDLALSNQALAAVEEIDAALEKIAHGRYGICEGCGELIPRPRLEALPYARLCIACKSGGLSRR